MKTDGRDGAASLPLLLLFSGAAILLHLRCQCDQVPSVFHLFNLSASP